MFSNCGSISMGFRPTTITTCFWSSSTYTFRANGTFRSTRGTDQTRVSEISFRRGPRVFQRQVIRGGNFRTGHSQGSNTTNCRERREQREERERGRTYKDVGDTAAAALGAPSVGGLDVEAENASSVTAKTRHGSYLTAQWVNGESRRVLSPENLIPDLGVCSLVWVFRLAE